MASTIRCSPSAPGCADFDGQEHTAAPGLSFHVGDKPPAIVSVARQALAIDERRADFRPEIWRGAHAGQSVEQRWFPGVHTSIGGGYADDGLANGALRWMIDAAKAESLVVDEAFLRFYRPWFGDTRDESFKGFMKVRGWIGGLVGETGDRDLEALADVAGLGVDESAIRLLAYDKAYRPRTCWPTCEAIRAWLRRFRRTPDRSMELR